jgi:hypothetical protein
LKNPTEAGIKEDALYKVVEGAAKGALKTTDHIKEMVEAMVFDKS